MGLAVRAQCALEMARSPVAELLGRVIDAALSAGGDGRGFKPWATLPLQAECRPPRPTLVASSHGATCARFGASSASATASTGQPACTAESAASAPDMPRNLSLSSAWAAVITMLARAAWWRSDGKMGSTCAAPATQPATPHKYRESAPSKSLLGSAVGTMLFCAVTLNFSVLSPEAALMQFDEVPFDTPVQSLVEASAGCLASRSPTLVFCATTMQPSNGSATARIVTHGSLERTYWKSGCKSRLIRLRARPSSTMLAQGDGYETRILLSLDC